MTDDQISLRDLMEQGFNDLRGHITLVRQEVADLKGMWVDHDRRIDDIDARQKVQEARISWIWAILGALGMTALGIIASVLLSGCIPVEPTITPLPTDFPVTGTPEPPPTIPPPTATLPPTPVPTPTGEPVTEMVQLAIQNPGMEAPYLPLTYNDRLYDNILVAEGWHPIACSDPWVVGGCAAVPLCGEYQTEHCNPADTRMGRPEYNGAASVPDQRRLYQGEFSQHWFEFYRAGDGGVYQTITIPPGYEYCTVGAHVQTWSNSQDVYTSQLFTDDDRANVTWRIYVDLAAGDTPYASGVLVSRPFGYTDGIYDAWTTIDYSFPVGTNGGRATIFFMSRWTWPNKHNDSYLDGVWGFCERSIASSPDPTPTQTTLDNLWDSPMGEWCANRETNVRRGPGTWYARVPLEGETGPPYRIIAAGECITLYDIQAHSTLTEYPMLWFNCQDCNVWGSDSPMEPSYFALRYGGQCFGTLYVEGIAEGAFGECMSLDDPPLAP